MVVKCDSIFLIISILQAYFKQKSPTKSLYLQQIKIAL